MSELQPTSQEVERIGAGMTLGVTFWVLMFGTLLCVVAGVMLAARARTLEPDANVKAAERPEPEVSNVRSELFKQPTAGERLAAEQRRKLEQFGWVDQSKGIVRMPIDVAMDLEAQGAQP